MFFYWLEKLEKELRPLFCSGLFGANGRGAAVRNGTDVGGPSYIGWQPQPTGWHDLSVFAETFRNHTFVIEGMRAPEASSFVIATLAGLLICMRTRRFR
jgi:hypothetical protein